MLHQLTTQQFYLSWQAGFAVEPAVKLAEDHFQLGHFYHDS